MSVSDSRKAAILERSAGRKLRPDEKVKPFKDAEARIVGFEVGKGKHRGRLGALVVEMPNGNRFSIGTGFTDEQRAQAWDVGAEVTYRYTELTDAGLPKCASFLRLRADHH